MKNFTLIFLFGIITIACTRKPELSGKEIKKSTTTEFYHTVNNNSSAAIELVASLKPNEILILGDEVLVENVKIENNNGKLIFSNKKSISFNNKSHLKIKLNNSKLQKIYIAGSASFHTNDVTLTNDITFNISGAGEIEAKLLNNNTSVFVSGAGDILLSGKTKELIANMTGAGSLNAKDLITYFSTIDIAGAGDANVNTINQINVKISGVGNLDYKKNNNNLKVIKEVSGIGSINPY